MSTNEDLNRPPIGSRVQMFPGGGILEVTGHTERGFTYKGAMPFSIPRLGIQGAGTGEMFLDVGYTSWAFAETWAPESPAPVPPAQPPDLAKMVEAAAVEIIEDLFPSGFVGDEDNSAAGHKGEAELEIEAILLRHLQPLAEQRDDLQRWKNEQLAVESCWDAQAVGKLLGLPLGINIRANIESCIIGLQSQLTAAQEELAHLRHYAGGQMIFSDFQTADHMRDALNKLIADYQALQSSAQKGAEDGKRLDALQFDEAGNSVGYACVFIKYPPQADGSPNGQYPEFSGTARVRDIIDKAIASRSAKPEASP